MSKITISVDNTCDLGEELYKLHNLEVIYFGVVIGNDLYRDTEVAPDDIYQAVEKEGLLPKTNAALEIDYRELFENATKDGGSIIHFSMSDKLSASHANALRAAQGLERVQVIDTKSLSVGTGILAIKASEMVKQGKNVPEIIDETKRAIAQADISFIIKDLNYLYRGGRASGLKLLGANLLKIRPSLIINKDGKIIPDKKYRGAFEGAVKQWTDDRIQKSKDANKDLVFVVHSDINEEVAQGVITAFKKSGFKKVLRFITGPTLTTHVGRNMIGALFIN
ncbi:MAG: DegV family protein [Firmicutes bacterium]|nr:DegV family protein [Bacillota bacterium]